jgi:Mlc titration factor MtfA (ptsG expression regulator)
LPLSWLDIIKRTVPYYRYLTAEEQHELHGHIQVFLHEKRFEGAAGLEITDEIRLTIAAQACILLLNRDTDYFPHMRTVIVYPDTYEVPTTQYLPGGVVHETVQTRLGESWHRGPVVLAWSNVLHSASDPHDGHNVVFHEFAHELDAEDGPVDGAPKLSNSAMYTAWADVLGEEFNELIDGLTCGHGHLIDEYGATDPAEFFAVVTETFFERPQALKQRHPELYEQFRLYYQQDPAARKAGNS